MLRLRRFVPVAAAAAVITIPVSTVNCNGTVTVFCTTPNPTCGPSSGHSLVALKDGRMVLYGGSSDGGEPSAGRMFLLSNGEWCKIKPSYEYASSMTSSGGTSVVDEPEPQALPASIGHSAVRIGSHIYHWGGTSGKPGHGKGGLNGLWRLTGLDDTPDQWRWSIIREEEVDGEPHASRLGQAAAASPSGKLFINGGYRFSAIGTSGAHKVAINDTSIFDPAASVWTHGPPAPEERAGHSLVSMGKWMVLYGGVNPSVKARRGNVLLFDTESMKWTTPVLQGPIPPARSGHTAVALSDRRMLVFGGIGDEGD